jgi:hypothetical protein
VQNGPSEHVEPCVCIRDVFAKRQQSLHRPEIFQPFDRLRQRPVQEQAVVLKLR